MSFGVTPQGFNRMLESDIRAEIVAEWAPLFDVDEATTNWPDTSSPESQFLDPFCRQLGIVWEQIEANYQGGDPAAASGTLMDALLALNNLARLEPVATEVLAAISGTQGTTVPAGKKVSVLGSGAQFEAKASALITNASLLRVAVQVANASDIGNPYIFTLNGNAISSGSLGGSPTRDSIAYQLHASVNASSLVNTVMEAVFYGSAVLSVASVNNGTLYRVTLDGVNCDYTSDISATNQEIVNGLVAAINSAQENLVALGLTSSTFSLTHRSPGRDWRLALGSYLGVSSLTPVGAMAVKAKDLRTPFSASVDSRMAIDKLFSPQTYKATATGAIEAPSGTLTQIVTPEFGWTSITNFLDGVLGREVEDDDEARIRREEALSTGSGHEAAILSQLRRTVSGLQTARVYQNIMDTPDAEGRPGHSVEVLVQGGSDLDIANAIWATRAAGIKPYGNVNADGTVDPDGNGTGITIQDSNGEDQVINFSRPDPLYAFIQGTVTLYSEEEYPGAEAVEAALLAYGLTHGIGKNFLPERFKGQGALVSGVSRFSSFQIAVSSDPDEPSPSWGTADLAVSSRQILVFDSSRITVT